MSSKNNSHQFPIVYEDDSLLITDKPQGLACASGLKTNLCGLLFEQRPELKAVKGYHPDEGGLLNRLDNETGGLVLFAKTDAAFVYYSSLMQSEKIIKIYTAIVTGKVLQSSGRIDIPIAHHAKNQSKMVVADEKKRYRGKPQPAETLFKVIRQGELYTELEITINRGVRHQIRVHLAHFGHPVAGDKLYAGDSAEFENHLLYARKLIFTSMEGKNLEISVEVPFLKNFSGI